MSRTLTLAAVWVLAGALAACGSGGRDAGRLPAATPAPTEGPQASGAASVSRAPRHEPARRAGTRPFDGFVDVGGHALHVACRGRGVPAVVYLHGYGGSGADAGLVPGLLARRHRVCTYDRANDGRSQPVPGPITGLDSVRDLHALLRRARVGAPYVLLGSSLGGLIAVMYADRHPRDVAGMVLLDGSLPGDLAIERLVPRRDRLRRGDWRATSELFDRFTTYEQARRLDRGGRVAIPVSYLASRSFGFPPSWPARRLRAAIRAQQRRFVARFSPGRLVLVDAPHTMEPIIPGRIAREVERVLSAR